MDIKVYLAEQGMTPEEITALVGNEKAAKAMTAALAKFDEGAQLVTRSASELEAAKAEKAEAETFWNDKVTPALASVDKRVATAASETARYKAYLQTLKDQGYDVPGDLLAAPVNPANPTNPNPANPDYMTREEFKRAAAGTAPDLVTLISLSNEYADLYGKPYLQAEEDFAKARKANKPFRDFVRDEYKFADKKAERETARVQTLIDQKAEEKYKAREAELAARYGSNGDLRAPMPSRNPKVEQVVKEHGDSWKTSAGREQARRDRLKKFENITLQ